MDNFPEWFKILFVFLLGLEFGSFANVCIFRWPRDSSVTRPRRSFCPWCQTSIAWFDNLPVLSFAFLGGRCRTCRSPISLRYPAVELTTAALWVLAYLRLGPVNSFQQAVFLCSILALLFTAVVTTMTDLDWRLIPDNATLVLGIAGLLTAYANPLLGGIWYERLEGALIGLTVGAGTIWLIGWVGEKIFGKEAMGGGDVKLLAATGTVVGWQTVLLTLFLAAFIGGAVVIVGLSTGRLKRHQYIPFGPFLNLASIVLVLTLAENLRLIDVFGVKDLIAR